MIDIRYDGRFGNNMFQYTLARLLATKFNRQLGTDLAHNNIITNTPNPTGQIITNSRKRLINDSLTQIPKSLPGVHLVLWGWFQRMQFYKPYQEQIKTFFNYDKTNIATNTKDICMHVRLTDYYKMNWIIHPDYYLNILKEEEYDNIYVLTDNINDPYFEAFKDYNLINISGTDIQDFYKLMTFDKVIMSNSTFSWWSMFLGNSSKIYTFKRWITNPTNDNLQSHTDNMYDLPNAIPIIEKFLYE